MAKISLIGKDLAEVGMEFKFIGPLLGCSECGIKNVCFNLEPGKNYRVTGVREKLNNCFVFNGDKVKTIEVEELPETITMKFGRYLQEGSSVALKSLHCDKIACKYIEKCNVLHFKEGRKVTVQNVGDRVECPKGYDVREISINLA